MLFSILIPAFKEKYLKECIQSILSQTYSEFEIIIVNDASPENITSIVESFQDSRIRYYVNEKNFGAVDVVDNWNKCLSYAIGDYVICMGDDDKLLPDCLSEYANLISEYPGLGVYHSWTEIINEDSEVVSMQEARPIFESVYSMMWGRLNCRRLQFIGDFLFERKLLMANGGFFKLPLAWASDDITAYIAASHAGIANSQKPGFQYRVSSSTISKSSDAHVKLEAVNKEENWYGEFLKSEPMEDHIVEYTYWKMLNLTIASNISRKKVAIIASDLSYKKHRIIGYIINRRKYRLTLLMVFEALVRSIYNHKRLT